MALGTFVITWFVSAFGRDPVAAYGAAVRVEQIALVPMSGLNTCYWLLLLVRITVRVELIGSKRYLSCH